MLVDPHLPSKIFQGITTEVTGEGESAAPMNDTNRQRRSRHLRASRVHAGLADVHAVFRAHRAAGDGDQPRELRRRDAGAAHGPRRQQRDADAGAARTNESAGAAGDAAGRGGRIDVAAVRAGAVREDRRADRARGRGVEVRRVYATHMRSEGNDVLGALDEAMRIGREAKIPGRDLAHQGGGKTELGADDADRRQDRFGARGGRRRQREHLRVPGMVQRDVGVRPALGARRRRQGARRAAQGSRRRARESSTTCRRPTRRGTTNGRRSPGRRRSWSASSRIRSCCRCREDDQGDRDRARRRADRRAARHARRRRRVHGVRGVRDVGAGHPARAPAAVDVDRQRLAGHRARRPARQASIRIRAPTARFRGFSRSTCTTSTR